MYASCATKFISKDISVQVDIPDNPTAHNMYYLCCVSSVLDLKAIDNINYLTDFNNHWKLSLNQKRKLLALCKLFSCESLNDKVFYESNKITSFCNRFVNLEQTKQALVINSQIIIGGMNRNVSKIMFYNQDWILKYHVNALVDLSNEIKRKEAKRECSIS